MAAFTLPPSTPFLELPGKPPISWSCWLESFETYLVALGLMSVAVAHKKVLLKHCLGAEGQHVLGTLENGTDASYDTAVDLLKNHFTPPQSALLRRFLFRQ